MACSTNLIADIINDCTARPTKGIYPTAWIIPFSGREYTKTDNLITLLTSPTGVFRKIESNKFGLNVSSELVTNDVKQNGYLHKFSGILSQVGNKELDELDGIIVVVKKGTTYMVYGLQNGLWKSAQSRTANDNSGMLSVEFSSRADMEEDYSEYYFDTATVGGLFTIITPSNYIENLVHTTGLTLEDGTSTAQKVFLDLAGSLTGYIVLPNSNILTTTAGVIDTTWAGAAGSILMLTPKNELICIGTNFGEVGAADFAGTLTTGGLIGIYANECPNLEGIKTGNINVIEAQECPSLISIISKVCNDYETYSNHALTTFVSEGNYSYDLHDCPSLVSLTIGDATSIELYDNAHTAAFIATLLAHLVLTGTSGGALDISGGTNASYATWSAQAKADKTTLLSRSWQITNNA